MSLRTVGLIATLALALLAAPLAADAQASEKVAHIGYLSSAKRSSQSARSEAFRQGLRELGYVEGKNLVIEFRFAEGRFDDLPELAAELVRLKVDIIVSSGATVTRAARKATATIPIIMTQDNDPVGNGFVASLARPGGNITGLSSVAAELNGKRLELLKEIVPGLVRAAVLGTSANPGNAHALRETELAAGTFGVQLQYLDILRSRDLKTAFRAAGKGQADAALVLGGPLFNSYRTEIAELAAKSRLPTIYARAESVEAGGLMSYGVKISDLDRRAATYVDKILKGALAADLPVEQPTIFELVINLRTAKALGLTIPQSLLFRASKVIH